jgi:Rab5 GDP/GTP exchange factor
MFQPPRSSSEDTRPTSHAQTDGTVPPPPPPRPGSQFEAQDAAARQANAEAAEARRIQRAEHRTVVETLCGMFPNLDKEVIDDVVRQKQGRVGLAVDACLALTAGS